MLHRRGAQGRAKFRQISFPGFPVVSQHPDLDKFVGGQGPSRLLDHRLRKPLGADHHHGLQGVSLGLEKFSLFGREFPRLPCDSLNHKDPMKMRR